MTDRDLMPFGKYGKGKVNLTVGQVKERYPDYVTWLCDQDGFEDKNPDLFLYFTQGAAASSSESERDMDEVEDRLLKPTSPEFKTFWFRAYGERLRKNGGEGVYLSYLRVAISTWDACKNPPKDLPGFPGIPAPTGPKSFGAPMPPLVPATPPKIERPRILDTKLDEDIPF